MHARLLWYGAILLLCFGAAALPSAGQKMAHRRFTVEDGLPHSNVFRIYQDKHGFIWLGTEFGLSRFDGHRFDNFRECEEFYGCQILGFEESPDNTLWINTYNGRLFHYKAGTIREYLPKWGRIPRGIVAMEFDTAGRLWLFNRHNIQYLHNDTVYAFASDLAAEARLLHFRNPAGFNDGSTHAIRPLHTGSLLIAEKDGLFVYRNNTISRMFPSHTAGRSVHAIAAGADGTFWLGMPNCIMSIDQNGKSREFTGNFGQGKASYPLFCDPHGRVWSAIRSSGLVMIDSNGLHDVSAALNLQNQCVNDILIDREENIWLATFGAGLLRISDPSHLHYTVEDGLSNNYVHHFAEDSRHGMWFGTVNGVCRLDSNGNFTRLPTVQTAGNEQFEHIEALGIDSNGTLWVSSHPNLLFRFDTPHRQQTAARPHIHSLFSIESDPGIVMLPGIGTKPLRTDICNTTPVTAMYTDKNGTLYTSCYWGIHTLNTGGFRRWDSIPLLKNLKINAFLRSSSGELWVAGSNGVFRHNGDTVYHYGAPGKVPGVQIQGLCEDGSHNIWLATERGTAVFDGSNWRAFGTEHGLSHEYCSAIVSDRRGGVWIATMNGLNRYHNDAFILYDTKRGLLSNEIKALCADSRGNIWVGTVNGVSRFAPERSGASAGWTPNVYIHSVESIRGNTREPVGVELAYDNTALRIRYAAIAHAYPEGIRFGCRMLGLGEQWLETNRWEREYSSLPYGSYTFLVRAQIEGGPWSPPAQLTVIVHPPFWARWYFRLPITALVCLLVFLYYRYRINKHQRQSLEKLRVQQRIHRLERQALNAGINPHFLFNALNSIQYFFNNDSSHTRANNYLANFAKLIRLVLDDARAESISLEAELERLRLYLELEQMRLKNRLEWSVTVDDAIETELIHIPVMLIQPFVENAVWHGISPLRSLGRIAVRIRMPRADCLHVIVQDDGIGMENSRKWRSGGHVRRSRGIAMTRERLQLYAPAESATVRIDVAAADSTNPERPGTIVTIVIPLVGHRTYNSRE